MRILSLFVLMFMPLTAAAHDGRFRVFPQVQTVFPFFAGGGAGLSYAERFQIGLNYGWTPKPYAQSIGSAAASLGGNASYKDVIEAALQSNSLWRLNFQYNFSTPAAGWRVGLAVSSASSSGRAGIDKVLAAVNGRDYTQLKNLLLARGRSAEIDMTGSFMIGEFHAGFAWEIAERFSLAVEAGVAKILVSDVHLQSGLPAFEASSAGTTLLRQSEADLETIIRDYGVSPTLSLSAACFF